MDISSLWNQLLVNTSAVCLRPEASLIEGIHIITPYVTSSDTNSSLSSQNSTRFQENEADGDEDQEKGSNNGDDAEEACCNKKDNILEKKAIQRVRYSKEEYRCTECPYSCTTEKAFLRHLRWCDAKNASAETSQHLLSCPICGKDRRSEDTLSVHMTKHKQDKYFCCDICKFKTLQLKKLIQHRRMHTGEKPHLCPFCNYRSSRRDNLRSHVRRVHKKHDLPCDTFTPRSMVISPRKPT